MFSRILAKMLPVVLPLNSEGLGEKIFNDFL